MIIKLAWRNIWRNKRRTIITASSVAFAVLFAGILQAIEEGSWENVFTNIVSTYTGNIQIHKKGYWKNPSINDLIEYQGALEGLKAHSKRIVAEVPRLESYTLVSTGDYTRGAAVMGIDVLLEEQFSRISERVVRGQYLDENDDGVLLGKDLAEILSMDIGDTLILVSQGFRGANAVGQFPVKGVVRFASPQLNKTMIVMELGVAQRFYGAENMLNALVLQIDQINKEQEVIKALSTELDTSVYEIMSFEEMMPELVKSRELDTSGNYIIYSVLYMIIAFGIFGTILMMMKERQYETGVLLSIGMRRLELFWMIWWELILLAFLGVAGGIVIALAVAQWIKLHPIQLSGDFAEAMEKFEFEPIIPASTDPSIFTLQAMIVFVICLLVSVYPLYHILRLKPVEAMRE